MKNITRLNVTKVKNKPPTLASVNILSDHEKERLIQEQYGREKLTLTTTNKPSEGFKMEEKMAKSPINSRFVTREESDRRASKRASEEGAKKVQKTGHEACLAKVVFERRRISILTVSGMTISGELLEFDKYSLRLRDENDACMWYYKSAVVGFMEI